LGGSRRQYLNIFLGGIDATGCIKACAIFRFVFSGQSLKRSRLVHQMQKAARKLSSLRMMRWLQDKLSRISIKGSVL